MANFFHKCHWFWWLQQFGLFTFTSFCYSLFLSPLMLSFIHHALLWSCLIQFGYSVKMKFEIICILYLLTTMISMKVLWMKIYDANMFDVLECFNVWLVENDFINLCAYDEDLTKPCWTTIFLKVWWWHFIYNI
jgi:hypothetical protein